MHTKAGSLTLLWALWIAGCDRQAAPLSVVPTVADRPAVAPSTRPAAVATAKPIAAVERVILISVDGLRPDLIYRAGALNIMDLMHGGAFSLWAQTADVVFTLPAHASMLTGVKPARHGVDFNEYRLDVYPAFPTILQAAHERGLSTALISGKDKFRLFCTPGSIDWQHVDERLDEEVADLAVKTLRDFRPDLMVVHFAGADYVGHFSQWGSPEQIAAIGQIDSGVGQIMAAVDELKIGDSTVILLTADHGGAGNTHWDDPRCKSIPWIVRGPGLRKNFDLDRLGGPVIHIQDTFATISLLLGLPTHPDLDGVAIREIVAPPQVDLLTPIR